MTSVHRDTRTSRPDQSPQGRRDEKLTVGFLPPARVLSGGGPLPPPLQMLPLTDCHFELYDQSDSKGLLLVDVCSSGVEMTHMNTVVNSVRFHKGWPVVVQQKK